MKSGKPEQEGYQTDKRMHMSTKPNLRYLLTQDAIFLYSTYEEVANMECKDWSSRNSGRRKTTRHMAVKD